MEVVADNVALTSLSDGSENGVAPPSDPSPKWAPTIDEECVWVSQHATGWQLGEEGVIEATLSWLDHLIKPDERWAVEFGASNGDWPEPLTSAPFVKRDGWKSLLIEYDRCKCSALRPRVPASAVVVNDKVEPEGEKSIDAFMEKHGCPQTPALMVVDIDSHEYPIVANMKARPMVLCVETLDLNSPMNNPTEPFIPNIEDYGKHVEDMFGTVVQANAVAFDQLLQPLDYLLIFRTRFNSIYLRGDMVPNLRKKKLNIGCGPNNFPGYVGLDKRFGHDARKLDFPDNSQDEVYCVPAGQHVLRNDGWQPIESIRVGDIVLGATGWVGVKTTMCRAYSGRLVTLATPDRVTKVTENHPIATPLKWLKAGELRKLDKVVVGASQVQLPDFIHGVHVRLRVASGASLGASTSVHSPTQRTLANLSPVVVQSDATLTQLQKNLGLPTLYEQVWQESNEQTLHAREVAVHGNTVPRLALWGSTSTANSIGTARDSISVEHRLDPVDQGAVAICDLDCGSNLRSRTHTDTDAALAVNDTRQVSPLGISHVDSVAEEHFVGNVYNLETDDGTYFLDGVLTHNCSHLLEHFPYKERDAVLAEWVRVLKPGGTLRIAVPDMQKLSAEILKEDPKHGLEYLEQVVYGGHGDMNDVHQAMFTEQTLRRAMHRAGIGSIREFKGFIPKDCANNPYSINLEGIRRWWPKVEKPKIVLVLSQPRFTFSGHEKCLFELARKMDIEVVPSIGAFWDRDINIGTQCAIGMYDPDFLLYSDYDSVFDVADVERLLDTINNNPEMAAIGAVQMSRHNDKPLVYEDAMVYHGDVCRVRFHHFGLTIVRREVFDEMPQPWFWSVPGRTEEGVWDWNHWARSDADITFWRNLDILGFKVCQHNKVCIGHIIQCVKYPRDKGRGVQFVPIESYWAKGKPKDATFVPELYKKKAEPKPDAKPEEAKS